MFSEFGSFAVSSFQQKTEINFTAFASSPTGQECVLRAIRADLVSQGWLLRMEHEAKRLRQLETDGLCRPLAHGVEQDWVFLAYPFIHGTSLSRIALQESNSLDRQALVLDVGEACLSALQAVHSIDVIQRDIRSTHIVRTKDDRFVLGGYGPLCLAQAFGNHGAQALEFASFASPELSGSLEHDVTPASDLYSLGVVLFHALMGRPLFAGEDVGDVLFKHLTCSPSYEGLDSNTPDVVIQFIDRLLEKDVRDRYQSASSALSDLRDLRKAIQGDGDLSSVTIGCHDQRSELTEPSFVGREREMDSIKKEIAEVASGEHRTMIAIGKSGMGKSRLLLEAKRVAAQRGFSVFQSVASDQATQEPLAPLLTLVDQLAKRLRYNQDESARVAESLSEYQQEVAVAMPSLAEVLGWAGESLVGPEEIGQGRVITAFGEALRCCAANGPALLCVDDCQWLDKPSLNVLEDFAKRSPESIFLLIGSRPQERMSEEVLAALPAATELRFGELETEGIHVLVESMAGKLPVEVKDSVTAMSQGSPFLATAAMRGLVESKTLVPQGTGWRLDKEQLKGFQAAADSANVLLKRLEFLEEDTADLLAVGAVIGKQFDIQVPVALTDVGIDNAFRLIDAVREQGLVWLKPDGQIAFVHDKIREAVVSRIEDKDRQELHARIAHYLQKHEADRYFDLAYHFDAAQLPEHAWSPALKAAKEARKRYALDTAEAQYRIAIRAFPDKQSGDVGQEHPSAEILSPHKQHAIEVGLADTLLLLGRYDDADEWFDRALTSAPDSLGVAKVRLKQGDLAFKKGDKGEAMDLFEQALRDAGNPVPKTKVGLMAMLARELAVQTVHSIAPRITTGRRRTPTPAERLTWKLYSKLAHCYWYVRDKYHTLWAHLRELNLAEIYEPTLELAQAYSEHAPVMSLIPWQKRGLDYARRSLQIRKNAQDMWGQGQSRNFLSIMFYSGAKFDECKNQAEQAVSVLERTGDYWEIHMAQYQYAASLYRMGQLKDAAEAARDLYDSAIKLGDDQSSGNAIDIWVRASLGAVPADAIATELGRDKRDHQASCQLHLAEGVKKHLEQKYEAAIDCFEQAVAAVRATGVINAYITPNYTWLATSLRRLLETDPPKTKQRRDSLLNRLGKATRAGLFLGRRFQNELPHALREKALFVAMQGSVRRAIRLLYKSIRVAESQGAKYEAALSELELCRLQNENKPSVRNAERFRRATEYLEEIEGSVVAGAQTASLSLMDRFEKLLDAGRQIVAANSASDVLSETLAATTRLLRGDRVLILEAAESGFRVVQQQADSREFDPELVARSAQEGQSILARKEQIDRHGVALEQTGAFLACPILLNEQARFFLYVANTHLSSLFGDDECRIANYLASAAGGALERADGWEQLEALNESLENRVQERTEAVVQRSKELERTANELRDTQAKLEKAKTAAERASESKSEFLAYMSHEIRTPMSAVLGFTEILRTREVDQETQELYLRRIHNNGEHLLALLNDLLDFSKIEAEHLEVEALALNPLELVSDAASALESRASEKGISLEVAVEGQVPSTIYSDPTRVRQIVMNLVGNAIKFTSKGGVRVVLKLTEEAEPQFQIDVCDTGIGISPEQAAKIFDPFTQADASTTRQFGGTGLGLSISKKLSEALGGGISISSEVGVGSIFRVTIATGDISGVEMLDAAEASVQSLKQTDEVIRLDGARILVADDAEANREIIEHLLISAGAEVHLVENGAEALEAALVDRFDLVLLDMQMPVMDGYTAAGELRALGYSQPIVALTANSMEGDQERCLEAGCCDFLTKPIDFHQLLQTARSFCENSDRTAESESVLEDSSASETAADSSENLAPYMEQFGRDFLTSTIDKLDEMEGLVRELDLPELKRMAHEIRGSGGTFGMKRIESVMDAMEKAIDGSETELIQSLYGDFVDACRSTCGDFKLDLNQFHAKSGGSW